MSLVWNSKVALVLNLVLVVKSKAPYYPPACNEWTDQRCKKGSIRSVVAEVVDFASQVHTQRRGKLKGRWRSSTIEV